MDDKLKQIQRLLDAAEGNLHSARNLMREVVGAGPSQTLNPEEKAKELNVIEEGKIIEGVYNGESMVGPDGKEYPVPANYASKSKLVEGDVLKLTIAEDGSFIFKQIKPIERRKTIGTLAYSNGTYTVNAEGKTYKVLQASVTYYKGEPGDQVSIILPRDHESTWAAIENIIKATDIPNPNATAEDLANQEESGTSEPIVEAENQEAIETKKTEEDNDPVEDKPQDMNPSEATDEGPTIEFPPTGGNDQPETQESDEEILNNIAPKEEQTEEKPEEIPAPEEPPKNEDASNKGIKELDI